MMVVFYYKCHGYLQKHKKYVYFITIVKCRCNCVYIILNETKELNWSKIMMIIKFQVLIINIIDYYFSREPEQFVINYKYMKDED